MKSGKFLILSDNIGCYVTLFINKTIKEGYLFLVNKHFLQSNSKRFV